FDVVELLAKEGIPVQGHMGLVPTYSIWNRGLRGFGRTAEEAMELFRTFKRYEDAGAMSVEIECVAEDALNMMNDKTSIITFSLGSGNAGDVIFLFMTDICGEAPIKPKHAHTFRDLQPLHDQLYAERVGALKDFGAEVKAMNFPYKANSIFMHDDEADKFAEMLDKAS
ncbi:MAG: 3-methyl-2-oxobutanoate hydroxymethyltransferase, partial [Planctomycetota bacterium]